jgi:hypothetical protein
VGHSRHERLCIPLKLVLEKRVKLLLELGWVDGGYWLWGERGLDAVGKLLSSRPRLQEIDDPNVVGDGMAPFLAC